jgi:hypothetical protein
MIGTIALSTILTFAIAFNPGIARCFRREEKEQFRRSPIQSMLS